MFFWKPQITVLAMSLILGSPLALAGGNSSAGGNALRMNGKLYTLDLVEAGVEDSAAYGTSKLNPVIDSDVKKLFANTSFDSSLLSRKLSDISAFDQVTAVTLVRAMQMYSWFWVNPELVKVPDVSSPLNYPKEDLVQLAVRSGHVIRINRDGFKELDINSQTALILHEAVYSLVMPSSDEDVRLQLAARRAREITGYFFTSLLESKGFQGLQDLIGRDIPSLSSIMRRISSISFNNSNPEKLNVAFTAPASNYIPYVWTAPRLVIEEAQVAAYPYGSSDYFQRMAAYVCVDKNLLGTSITLQAIYEAIDLNFSGESPFLSWESAPLGNFKSQLKTLSLSFNPAECTSQIVSLLQSLSDEIHRSAGN